MSEEGTYDTGEDVLEEEYLCDYTGEQCIGEKMFCEDCSIWKDGSEQNVQVRICDNTCSHFDELNQCCWVATKTRLCSNVSEGDICLHGFKEGES